MCTAKGELRRDWIEVNDLQTARDFERRGLATQLLVSLEVHFGLRAIPEEIADAPKALGFWKKYLGPENIKTAGRVMGYSSGQLWRDFSDRLVEVREKEPGIFQSIMSVSPRPLAVPLPVRLDRGSLWKGPISGRSTPVSAPV